MLSSKDDGRAEFEREEALAEMAGLIDKRVCARDRDKRGQLTAVTIRVPREAWDRLEDQDESDELNQLEREVQTVILTMSTDQGVTSLRFTRDQFEDFYQEVLGVGTIRRRRRRRG